jgi:hypothetical protein
VSARTRATATITLGTNPIKALITAMTPSQTTTARMAREAYQHRQPLVPPTRPHRARWRVEPADHAMAILRQSRFATTP